MGALWCSLDVPRCEKTGQGLERARLYVLPLLGERFAQLVFEKAIVKKQHHAVVVLSADEAPRGLQHLVQARIGVGVGKPLALLGIEVVPDYLAFSCGPRHARTHHDNSYERLAGKVDTLAKDSTQHTQADKARTCGSLLAERGHKAFALTLTHARALPHHDGPAVHERGKRLRDLLHHGVRGKEREVVARMPVRQRDQVLSDVGIELRPAL